MNNQCSIFASTNNYYVTNINILPMKIAIDKRINWKETLLGLEVGGSIVIDKPTIQNVQTARTWSSKLKKQNVYTKVSLNKSVLTIKRIA